MSRYWQLLEAAVRTLTEHPDWPRSRVENDLCTRHAKPSNRAQAIVLRAKSRVEGASGEYRFRRRRVTSVGESNGVFDNIVRALEEAGD